VTADVGQLITCRVTGTNTSGSAVATSISIIPTALPENKSLPVVSVIGGVGSILTLKSTGGTWTGYPTPVLTYVWYRGNTILSWETSNTYVTQNVDIGQLITCRVTGTNTRGSVVATSNSITTGPPANNAQPQISGNSLVGSTLTTTNGTWIGYPTPTLTYQWYRGNTSIPSATNNTYVTQAADVGQSITCHVTGVSTSGSAVAISTSLTITSTFVSTSLHAHYDASDASSYTLSGGNVTQWNDLTGNGYHLTANGTGPTLTTIKSVRALNFDSSRGLIRTSVRLSSEITIFMVIKYSTNIGIWGSFMHHGNRDSDWALERDSWSTITHNIQFQSDNINGTAELSTTNGVNYILVGRISGNNREFWRYSDTEALGFATGSGVSIVTDNNKSIYVGKSDNNEACNSTIGEILYYNASLSDADVTQNVTYLQKKWLTP
jgi:hypothetical protein